jgi:glucokinase
MSTYRDFAYRGSARATVLRTMAARERRSHLTAPRVPTVGIDIGGTKVMAGVVDADGNILEKLRAETPDKSKSPKVVEDTIVELVLDLSDRHDVHAVGIGAAGWVDAERNRVLFAPHLSWRNEPLRDRLSGRLSVPVLVDNDANTAAWAEWRFGAGRGEADLVMITLGTGIGGGLVVDGHLYVGRNGFAGEFGHMVVDPNGPPCVCGRRGCWERYASGSGLAQLARAAAVGGRLRRVVGIAGGDVELVRGEHVQAAAEEGDPGALAVIDEFARWVALGLVNLTNAFDPAAFVLGGGLAVGAHLYLAPIRRWFVELLYAPELRPHPVLSFAELGEHAGAVGAALLPDHLGA